jgi:hypothetical protein
VTKTQTTRFQQYQYSSGSDSFLRADVNADAAGIEQAAYDDGATYTVLPAVGDTIAGRYVMYQPAASPYHTLYRATAQNGSWEQVIGNALPAPVTFRPYAAGDQAATTAAATWTHPSLSAAPASITYGGLASFASGVIYDPNTAANGALHVGTNAAPAPSTLGRAHVRTRVDGDRGLVLQPHGAGAGNMFTAREPGGTDVTTIDANGYLRARSLSAFGGGAVTGTSAVVIAPTSNASDGVSNGLMLYGQSGAGSKTILAVQRDASDTAPIATIGRDSISIGRLPWNSGTTTGTVAISAQQHRVRATGFSGDTGLWGVYAASATAPGDATQDQAVLGTSRTSIVGRTPIYLTQELDPSNPNLTVDRYAEFSVPFARFRRVVGGAAEIVASLEADGRLQTGARWLGGGTMIDARASLKHFSVARWAQPRTDGPTAGIRIDPIGSAVNAYTYDFPVMQLRSVSACDLEITSWCEMTFATDNTNHGLSYFLEIYASINGGSFNLVHTAEGFQATVDGGQRPTGDNFFATQYLDNLPTGATVQFRLKLTNNTSADGASIYIRAMKVVAEECLLTEYSTS